MAALLFPRDTDAAFARWRFCSLACFMPRLTAVPCRLLRSLERASLPALAALLFFFPFVVVFVAAFMYDLVPLAPRLAPPPHFRQLRQQPLCPYSTLWCFRISARLSGYTSSWFRK